MHLLKNMPLFKNMNLFKNELILNMHLLKNELILKENFKNRHLLKKGANFNRKIPMGVFIRKANGRNDRLLSHSSIVCSRIIGSIQFLSKWKIS